MMPASTKFGLWSIVLVLALATSIYCLFAYAAWWLVFPAVVLLATARMIRHS